MNHIRTENGKIIVHVPLTFHTRGGKKVIIGPQGQDLRTLDAETRRDDKLLKALGRAYLWQGWVQTGKFKTAMAMAEKEKIDKSYMQRIMRIMQLSPKIIEAILDGEQPDGFALREIERTFSPIWDEQAKMFGFDFNHARSSKKESA